MCKINQKGVCITKGYTELVMGFSEDFKRFLKDRDKCQKDVIAKDVIVIGSKEYSVFARIPVEGKVYIVTTEYKKDSSNKVIYFIFKETENGYVSVEDCGDEVSEIIKEIMDRKPVSDVVIGYGNRI